MEIKLDINYVVDDSEKLDIRELRRETGMSRQQFCGYFRLPYRTLQSWELGDRETPDYVKRLLAYTIRINKLIEKKKLVLKEETEHEGEEDGKGNNKC